MSEPAVERRAAQLRLLRTTDPAQIIEYYRRISGDAADGQVPGGASFAEMIHTILVHEVRTGKLDACRPQLSE